MTPQQAKALLPVIQAFAEGKTVQQSFKHNGTSNDQWAPYEGPLRPDQYMYRIKPAIDLSTAKVGDRFRTRGGSVAIYEGRHGPDSPYFKLYVINGPKIDNHAAGNHMRDGSESEYDLLEPLGPATLRPWRPEEVPVGAVVRSRITGERFLITSSELKLDGIEDWEWRFPQETEWKACGVEE